MSQSPDQPVTESVIFDTFLVRAMRPSPSEEIRLEGHITSKLYPLIMAEWLVVIEYSFTGLFQIEYYMDAGRTRREPEELDEGLQKLHKWQRRLPFFTSWLESAIRALEYRYGYAPNPSMATMLQQPNSTAPRESTSSNTIVSASKMAEHPWRPIISDLRTIHARVYALSMRADKIMTMATAVIGIDENKRALTESRSVTRITYLAFVFIPMSFVATLFSMNIDAVRKDMSTVYWAFFATAVPLSGLAFLIAMYWVPMTRLIDKWRLDWRRKKAS